jgi:hypothetical protein
MAMKTCKKCGETKTIDLFGVLNDSKDGRKGSCLDCCRSQNRAYVARMGAVLTAKNRERRRLNPEADRAYQAKYRIRRRAKNLIRHAKRRAGVMSLPFDLDDHVDNLQVRLDAGVCEMTAIPFNPTGDRRWDSASLDRIEPKKGYVISNIRVVCLAINCAMGDWGPEVMVRVVSEYLNHHSGESP